MERQHDEGLIVDLDLNPVVDAMFNAGRTCLAARDALVVQASQG